MSCRASGAAAGLFFGDKRYTDVTCLASPRECEVGVWFESCLRYQCGTLWMSAGLCSLQQMCGRQWMPAPIEADEEHNQADPRPC